MGGALAVLFGLVTITDMATNDTRATLLERASVQAYVVASAGATSFHWKAHGAEARLSLLAGSTFGPFQPMAEVSVTDRGGAWVGLGALHTRFFGRGSAADGGPFVAFSFLPGLYARGNEVDLGHVIEFRSGIELGYQFASAARLSVSLDHRSNGDIAARNPGIETVQIRYYLPF